MEIGKKKKKLILNQSEEESQNSLHKNKNTLEYQNRCLIEKIEYYKGQVDEKNCVIKQYEQNMTTLREAFISINFELYNLNEATLIITEHFDKNPDNFIGKKIELGLPSELLKCILDGCTSEKLSERYKELFSDIQINLTNLLNNLMSTFEKEHELRKMIDDSFAKNIDKIQNEISVEYGNLRKKEKGLQKKYIASQEIQKTITKENQLFKSQLTQYESFLKEKNEKLDDLEKKYANISRKYNSKPFLPYIVMESRYFEKHIPNHKCICHICGEKSLGDENKTEGNEIKKEDAQENSYKNSNSLQMNIDEVFKSTSSSEKEKSLLYEIELLTKQKNELLIELENKKLELNVSEERFIASKPYQILLSQAEAMMHQLDKLKEMNIELHKQKIELLNQKESDLKNYETKDNERRLELEKKIEELTRQYEEEKSKGCTLQLKIEYLKNEIDCKNSTDFSSLFTYYESDKIKLNKNIETLKQSKNELTMKYNDEREKNENNEKFILKLNSEIDRLKQNLKNDGIDPDNQNFQKFDVKEREEMKRQLKVRNEKITFLDKKIIKMKGEIQIEKENAEKLINELELNEKGFEDLNKKIKALTLQLQESNEKIAKLTNEKIKDMNTLKLFNEQREVMDKRLKEQDELIENLNDYQKKVENEIILQREINSKLETEVKLLEEDNDILKRDYEKAIRQTEEYKSSYEQAIKGLNYSKNESVKNLTNYEQIKNKLEEIVKNKMNSNLTPKSIDSMQKENEVLTFENDKLKKMIKCSICKIREKSVILLKCFHTFCKECVDKNIENRYRMCPICRRKISNEEVKSFWWE